MSTSLIAVTTKNDDAANVLAVSTSGDFLPRVKLCQGSAKEVNARKVARGGCFALLKGKDDVEDLGEEVPFIPICGRAKALDTSGDMILTNFEPKSAEFLRIKAESAGKDTGCMYGPEFLIWLPTQGLLATLFLCSASARREGDAVYARKGNAAQLTSLLVDNKKFQWFVPVCKDYSSPIEDLLTPEEFQEAADKFMNERSSTVRAAESPDADARER